MKRSQVAIINQANFSFPRLERHAPVRFGHSMQPDHDGDDDDDDSAAIELIGPPAVAFRPINIRDSHPVSSSCRSCCCNALDK